MGPSKKTFMKTLYTKTGSIKRIKLIGAAAALILLPGFAQAQSTILSWNLLAATGNETTYNSTTTDPHLATSVMGRSGTVAAATGQASCFMNNTYTQTTKGDQGITFQITPASGYQVSLSAINYKVRNQGSTGASGPQGSFRWQYSLDGVNFTDLGPADLPLPASSVRGVIQTPIDLTGASDLQNTTGTITMRLVAWNLLSTTAMFGIGRSVSTGTLTGPTDSVVLALVGTVTPSGPLPVTLQSFQAIAAQSDADLSWATAMEKNSSHFNIERSSNGKDFTNIGKIASKNEAAGAYYTYTDAGALLSSDHQYYRLQSVDKDGTTTYSNVVRVNAYNAVSAALLLYPNPATKAVTIETNLAEDGLLQVFNTMGQIVLEQKIEKAHLKTELNTASFAKGTYIVRLRNGQQTSTQQLIIR